MKKTSKIIGLSAAIMLTVTAVVLGISYVYCLFHELLHTPPVAVQKDTVFVVKEINSYNPNAEHPESKIYYNFYNTANLRLVSDTVFEIMYKEKEREEVNNLRMIEQTMNNLRIIEQTTPKTFQIPPPLPYPDTLPKTTLKDRKQIINDMQNQLQSMKEAIISRQKK
ncbi:MAG: hypothetical protein LBQ64_01155 [Bacteroidales bacterium]|jgi:hypothetical protein|nr:hypothetical protein [Bacteroidales bacterium]